MTHPVVDAGVEYWEEDVLDILADDDLARDVDDLGIGEPRYLTEPGGKRGRNGETFNVPR